MFLCLSGSLPFDHESSDKEIARQTIYDNPDYSNTIWKMISSDAKDCVSRLLEKNPDKRMKITDLLNHPWLLKAKKRVTSQKSQNLGSISKQPSDQTVEILKSFVK